jgi:hypothetical protein
MHSHRVRFMMHPAQATQMSQTTPGSRAIYTMEGAITRADKARSPFIYLPFLMPSGATRLTVRYHYSGYMPADEHGDGNTLDLGLFGPGGPGGIAFGAADFRGWSGSFRSEVTITPTDATPSYLPGLPPGEWNVFLGAYNIGPNDCRYSVEVSVDTEDTEAGPPAPAPTDEPPAVIARIAPRGPAWYKGDLHCHTFHSDGGSSLREITDAAKEQGLHFLAITDHNTISHHAHLDLRRLPAAAGRGDHHLLRPRQRLGHQQVGGVPLYHQPGDRPRHRTGARPGRAVLHQPS